MRLSQNVGQRMAVAEVRKHRSYNSATINNDIAILTFTTQPTEGSNVMPACMPSRDHGVNELSYVTGWGTTSEGKLLPLTTSLVWLQKCPLYKKRNTNTVCSAHLPILFDAYYLGLCVLHLLYL